MSLEAWDELRTALHVARSGTVSEAAQQLGVHHATVIRHIDALEDRLGVKLFQRHAKDYALTEAGHMLTDSAADAEARFDNLATRLSMLQTGIEGELNVTTVPELSEFVLPVLMDLRARHGKLVPSLRIEARLARLEYGEAHLAIRAGTRPQEPDNVVQALRVAWLRLAAPHMKSRQSPDTRRMVRCAATRRSRTRCTWPRALWQSSRATKETRNLLTTPIRLAVISRKVVWLLPE